MEGRIYKSCGVLEKWEKEGSKRKGRWVIIGSKVYTEREDAVKIQRKREEKYPKVAYRLTELTLVTVR
ncbi:MAG: hypothetical protein GY861_20705 [bacterium]|nr:hypothetical protein [bacterium]